MEQDPDILILVHNTATTNFQADERYRELALAHLSFSGIRVNLDDQQDNNTREPNCAEQEMKPTTEKQRRQSKRALSVHSSQEEEQDAPRKRVLLDPLPVVQVESSPVYIPMSPFHGFTQHPLAYSISSDAVRSSMPELSTFLCEPGVQTAFTLEPVTPRPASVSVIPETVIRRRSQLSQVVNQELSSPIECDESTPEIPCTPEYEGPEPAPAEPTVNQSTPPLPSLSVVPETVFKHSSRRSQRNLGDSSPIEYDPTPAEIPDSQPTPPKGRGIIIVPAEYFTPSDKSNNTTVTHVSESPVTVANITTGQHKQFQKSPLQDSEPIETEDRERSKGNEKVPSTNNSQAEVLSTPVVAMVKDTTIASVIEISPAQGIPETPKRRVVQFFPAAPRFSSLSPLSPLQNSMPETCTSPDKLPHRFPLFTGQPLSPRSLLAYMLEKDLDSLDRQLLHKDNYTIDKRQVNHFLELRQLSEYNITSPVPDVNSNPKQITPMMEKLYANANLDKYFRPKIHSREIRKRERGYWRIDMSRWPRPKPSKKAIEAGGQSTAEKKHAFWTRLAGYVKAGKMGETRLFFESENEGAGEQVGDILRLYCYGEAAIHIWVILYAISDRIVSELRLKWVDAGGQAVIEM